MKGNKRMIKGKKLAVLGAGKMGETLLAGMLDSAIFFRGRKSS